jgi:uncharacterized iron-regulated protein
MQSLHLRALLSCVFIATFLSSGFAAEPETKPQPKRFSLWVDLCTGEPCSYERVVGDLATANVIYLGERHAVSRHHNLQARIVQDLAAKKIPLVLGLEMMEKHYQPILDQYNQGEIDFEQLAEKTDWKHHWNNYQDYKEAIEAAHKAGAPILALNARAETIRSVARKGGLDKIDEEARKELPAGIQLDDPVYKQMIRPLIMGHIAVNPDLLEPIFAAQICRDETMAATLCDFLKTPEGKNRTAVVLCGNIHAACGLGIPARVHRRLPAIKDRIVSFSESGDVKLTPPQIASRRPVHTTREEARKVNLRLADYLHVTTPKKAD